MGLAAVGLELRCPKTSRIVASADPEPYWSLDDLLSDLNSLDAQLGGGAPPLPLKNPPLPRPDETYRRQSGSKPFAMSVGVSDDDDDDEDYDNEDAGRSEDSRNSAAGTRFSCNDLDFSDSEGSSEPTAGTRFSCDDLDSSNSDGSSEEEEEEGGKGSLLRLAVRPPTCSDLMRKKNLEESILLELEFKHMPELKERLRRKLTALEIHRLDEQERSSSAILRLQKQTEAKREMDMQLDKQYRRKVAQTLDHHLSAIQRDFEQRSQIEEQRIRAYAAILAEEESNKRKEKARQDAEEEAGKIVEMEAAATRAAKEAAEKEAADTAAKEAADAEAALKKATDSKKKASVIASTVMAADAALEAEATRLKLYDQVTREYNAVSQDVISRYGRKIRVCVGQISGTLENVRTKACVLLGIITNNTECPRSISVSLFSNKVVSLCDNPTRSFDTVAFACAHVVLLLASQVPDVMESVLAEFHKACIYTVPKHPSNTDGDLISDNCLERVRSYMKLYAALIQTEIDGIENPHGLKEGWRWLARFLNALPANRSTAVALEAFLKMAGFSLNKRYGRQFLKLLNVICKQFLPALKKNDPAAGEIITRLEKFLELKSYKEEPEGRLLKNSLLSDVCHA